MIRILYAEDDEFLRSQLVEHLVTRLPLVTVTQARSGNDAIKILESGQIFDIVISDYSMPDGNGGDLLRYIYEEKKRCVFAFYTGSVNLVLPNTDAFFLGVIEKPDFEMLVERITSVIIGGFFSEKRRKN